MKIKRDAFLYMDGNDRSFAQCGSCIFGKNHCAIMGGEKVSAKDGSCNFYIEGLPIKELVIANLGRTATGYVERQVRCQNCKFFSKDVCNLYLALNKGSTAFQLDPHVSRYGCCNANTPGF